MAPKKDKKKVEEAPKGPQFTEVERTFMELTIADCNRKIARLKTAVDDYERRNEELQQAYDKLDEDRADIIAYLKKTLNLKNEENNEFKEKIKGLEETREIETSQFKETVTELEKNFTTMKDQLTSENKLLAGKLNTLEEFRAIRDDLMKKYENQEQAFKDQEMKYKRVIYDAEKKFVIGKDKLKKEMEARLLQLAQDFQDATELRIAASTHRVIRENIAINNELDTILSSQSKLSDQNERLRESERAARTAMELAEQERDKAINKSVVQLKVIDQLTNAYEEVKKQKALFDKRNFDLETLQGKVEKLSTENGNYSLQVRILEQKLHSQMTAQNKSLAEAAKISSENKRLRHILKEAAISVKAALKLDEWATTDTTREIMDRQILLSRLLEIITKYRDIERADSIDSLVSVCKVYQEGDLGFIPKEPAKKSVVSTIIAPTVASKDIVRLESKGSLASISTSSESLGSVKTIPSINILPVTSKEALQAKDSLPSFITSSHSTIGSEAEPEEDVEMTDVERKLAESKLEIQKSILKDLGYSSIQMKSQVRVKDETRPSTILEEDGAVEGEHKQAEDVEAEGVQEEDIEVKGVEDGKQEGDEPKDETKDGPDESAPPEDA